MLYRYSNYDIDSPEPLHFEHSRLRKAWLEGNRQCHSKTLSSRHSRVEVGKGKEAKQMLRSPSPYSDTDTDTRAFAAFNLVIDI
jgi:hypothetical protein